MRLFIAPPPPPFDSGMRLLELSLIITALISGPGKVSQSPLEPTVNVIG